MGTEVACEFPPIQGVLSYEDQDGRIATAIRALARRLARPLRILEAGCGNRWPIDLADVSYQLTGLDLDAAALDIRRRVEQDLDETIHGDLCTVDLPAASFDVVYSAYVLEHIRDAEVALDRMIRVLNTGGLLILRIPDPQTARGLVVRMTPFWFHVFYHRWAMKRPNAGKPGHAPYPTHYHPVIFRRGLQAFTQNRPLRCKAIYADTFVRDGEGIVGALFRSGARIVTALSLGRFTSRYNDLIYIFEKV